LAAKRLFDEGKYEEAIDKYMEAIEQSDSNDDKASYWFSIASIQFRKLGRYATARESAQKATKYRSNWGRPYMLIGDMYGTTARNCGDAWQQSLAILAAIEKYRYAKSIDSEVADEAQGRINTYWGSRPSQDLGFMQGVKDGDKVRVDCWIGEIVTMDYKK
jgi:tetratricopeptide (TPR) repeat protein